MSNLKKPPVEALSAIWGEQDSFSVERVAGGMSGATVWRVTKAAQVDALRHLPAAIADPSWVEKTAQVLLHAHSHGAPFVPQPIGQPYQATSGDCWQATTWCPGTPALDTHFSQKRIQAATEALAKFHHAVSFFSSDAGLMYAGPSPAFKQRIDLLESCVRRLPSQQTIPPDWQDLAQRFAEYIPPLVKIARPKVRRYAKVTLPLQPVQIDSRPEHFLFTGDTVTGLIDFGAMRVDSPAVDVARLAGELAKGNQLQRNGLVEQYNNYASKPVDASLVEALDISGAVLAMANWLGWLADGRALRLDPLILRPRLENLANRAQHLANLR